MRRRHDSYNLVAGRVSASGKLLALAPIYQGRVWVICRDCGRELRVNLMSFYRVNGGCNRCRHRVENHATTIRMAAKHGSPIERIARAIGFSTSAVADFMRKNDIPRTGKKPRKSFTSTRSHPSAAHRADVVAYARTHTAREAALRYGVSERTIVRWRNGYVKKIALVNEFASDESSDRSSGDQANELQRAP